jgi:DNA-binding HxlR family transcriptional regulator
MELPSNVPTPSSLAIQSSALSKASRLINRTTGTSQVRLARSLRTLAARTARARERPDYHRTIQPKVPQQLTETGPALISATSRFNEMTQRSTIEAASLSCLATTSKLSWTSNSSKPSTSQCLRPKRSRRPSLRRRGSSQPSRTS